MQERNWTHALLNGMAFGAGYLIGWWLIRLTATFAPGKFIFLETFVYFFPATILAFGLLFALIANKLSGAIHQFLIGNSHFDAVRWLIFGSMFGLTYQLVENLETTYGGGLAAMARVSIILLGYLICFRLFQRPTQ